MPAPADPRGARRGTGPIGEFLAEETAHGSWPGAVWVVEERGHTLSAGAEGAKSILPSPSPAGTETIYDLASLTKPLATAALLALLQDEGRIDLEVPAATFLPDLACAVGGAVGGPTLLDLALHRSGLPAWRPFYAHGRTPAEVLRAVSSLPAEAPCGEKVVYSDAGYILLGEILRQVTGQGIAELFAERIAKPLALTSTGFLPAESLRTRIAPTELGNRHEQQLAARFLDKPDPARSRDRLLLGEVHDGNAYALGGAAGHAGLFGTAGEVARLAREFLPSEGGRSKLFRARSLALFRENATPGLEEARSLGWKLARAGCREAEGVLPPESFGHTGFTGTSVFIDPLAERVYVLLTNRVHPEVRGIDMNLLRRRFHQIARALHD